MLVGSWFRSERREV